MKWYQKSYFWSNVHLGNLKEGKENLNYVTVVFTHLTYSGLLLDMYSFEKVLITQIRRILRFLERRLEHSLLPTKLLTQWFVKYDIALCLILR